MAKQQKPRMTRQVQGGGLAAMERLEQRSDEELEAETRFKAAAFAILGARAAERYDARATRAYYQKALAAARPQERMQLRRMADASIALAERRAGDLKDAVTRLGQTPPSDRQLLILRLMGLVAPPPGASVLTRLRGFAIIFVLVVGLLLIGLGLAELVSLPFGGVSLVGGILLGIVIVAAILGVLALFGRRKQARARAAARAARR
ncbi:MAG: hypothetical protein JSS99_15500 [Actinobacteria bacterium]|nr:hypothetical protein [Actinomycetota bacterium]